MVMDGAARSISAVNVRCVGCGACELRCEAKVPVRDLLLGAARERVSRELGLLVSGAALSRLADAWLAAPRVQARAAIATRCGCGASSAAPEEVVAYAAARGVHDIVALPALDCGRELLERGQLQAFDLLSPAVGEALSGARSLVVASGGCAAAYARHAENARLLAFYVSTLENWLARFGLGSTGATRPSGRFAGCRTAPDPLGCCGAYGLLAEVAADDADAAAKAVLARAEAMGVRELLVEDAVCARHLRAQGSAVRIAARADALSSDEAALGAPHDDVEPAGASR